MNLDLFRKPLDVRAEQADGVPLIFGFGAGVNSVAGLVLMRDLDLRPDLIPFADTIGEKPATYAYFPIISAWLRREGFPPITFVKNESPIAGDASLEASCLRLKTLPSRAFGLSSCALKWKVEPQEKFLNHWQPAIDAWARGVKPIKVLGYDGGEERRASIIEDKKLRYWYPLLERNIGRSDCEAMIRREALPVPPKSACFFCPSSTKSEVLALAEQHPDLFARAVEMERVAAPNLKNVKGLGRHWSWEGLVTMRPAERESLLEQPVESCLVCVDQGEAA